MESGLDGARGGRGSRPTGGEVNPGQLHPAGTRLGFSPVLEYSARGVGDNAVGLVSLEAAWLRQVRIVSVHWDTSLSDGHLMDFLLYMEVMVNGQM